MPDVKPQRRRPQGSRSEAGPPSKPNELRKVIEVANVDEDVAREAIAAVDAHDLNLAVVKAMELQKEKDAWQEKKSKKEMKAEKEAEQQLAKIQAQKQAKDEAKKNITTQGKSNSARGAPDRTNSRRPEQNGDVSQWNGHSDEAPDDGSAPRTTSTRGRGATRGFGRGGRGARGGTTRADNARTDRRSEARAGTHRDGAGMTHNNSVSEWASSGIEPTSQSDDWAIAKTEQKPEPVKSAPAPPKPMINGYASAAIRGQQKEEERKRQAEAVKRKALLAKQEKTTPPPETPRVLKEVDTNQAVTPSKPMEKTPDRQAPPTIEKIKTHQDLLNTPPPGLSLVRPAQEDNTKTNAKGQEILDSLRSKPATQETVEEVQNRLMSPAGTNRSTVSPAVGQERSLQQSRQAAPQAVVFAGDAGQPSSSVDVQFGYVPEQRQIYAHPQNISNAISALAPEQQAAHQAQIYQQVHQAPPSTSALEGQTHDLSQAFAAAAKIQGNTWQTGPPPTAYAQSKQIAYNGAAYNAPAQNYDKTVVPSSSNTAPTTNGVAPSDPSGKSDALAFAQNMLNKNADKMTGVQTVPHIAPQQMPYQQYSNQYQYAPGQLQAVPMFHSPVDQNSHQNPLAMNQLQQPPPGMAPSAHHFNAASQDLSMWTPAAQSSTWSQYPTGSHQAPLTSSSEALGKGEMQQFNTNLLNLTSNMIFNPYQQPPMNAHLMMPVVSSSSLMGGLPHKQDYFAQPQQPDLRDYQQQQSAGANRNGQQQKTTFDTFGANNMNAAAAGKTNYSKPAAADGAKLPQQGMPQQQQMMAQYGKPYQSFGNVQTPPPGSGQQQYTMMNFSMPTNYMMNPMNMQAMQPHMNRTDAQAAFPGYGAANAAIFPKPSGW